MARIISNEWQHLYNHPVYYLDSFIDTEKFLGTCYRAANWQFLGLTKGRGKNEKHHIRTRSLKQVLGYPLRRDFRRLLCEEPSS